jgi:hypothetical protein
VASCGSPAISAPCASTSLVSSGRLRYCLGAFGLADGQAALPGGECHHAFGQCLEPLAFGAAVEIAADRGFVPVEEPQCRDDQPDRLEQEPDRQEQDQRQEDRDDRGQREFAAGHRQERDTVHLGQAADTEGEAATMAMKISTFSKDQSMMPPP